MTDRKIRGRTPLEKNTWVEGESAYYAGHLPRALRSIRRMRASFTRSCATRISRANNRKQSSSLLVKAGFPFSLLLFYFSGKTITATSEGLLSNYMTFKKQTRLAGGVGVKQQWLF